jgi:predicted ArsR family transcriptional regulator
MTDTWMTYADLADRLGVSAEAARQRAVRGRWRRQTGNDGKTLVLVEPEILTAKKRSGRPLGEYRTL